MWQRFGRAMRHVTARFVGLATAAALGVVLSAGCGPAAAPLPALPSCEMIAAPATPGAPALLAVSRPLMGTRFEVRAVATDLPHACRALHAALDEVARQERLLSEYRPDSEVSLINARAGQAPVEVDPGVFAVLERAQWAATVTGGAFDITFAPCGRLWSIREQRVPEAAAVAACLDRVGFRRLRLDAARSAVFFERPDMAIGIGGIGKGHGVDRAADVLRAHGLDRFLVDGGGDVRVEGHDLDDAWTIAIAHPRRPGQALGTIRLERGAIVTSGDYVRFFERDGVRHHHILDPSTGHPATRSVATTVIAPTATEADALSTGFFVLGPQRAIEVAERLPGVETLVIDPDLRVHVSSGFPPLDGTGGSRVDTAAAPGTADTRSPAGSGPMPAGRRPGAAPDRSRHRTSS